MLKKENKISLVLQVFFCQLSGLFRTLLHSFDPHKHSGLQTLFFTPKFTQRHSTICSTNWRTVRHWGRALFVKKLNSVKELPLVSVLSLLAKKTLRELVPKSNFPFNSCWMHALTVIWEFSFCFQITFLQPPSTGVWKLLTPCRCSYHHWK